MLLGDAGEFERRGFIEARTPTDLESARKRPRVPDGSWDEATMKNASDAQIQIAGGIHQG
jgi:hypothetical protein